MEKLRLDHLVFKIVNLVIEILIRKKLFVILEKLMRFHRNNFDDLNFDI